MNNVVLHRYSWPIIHFLKLSQNVAVGLKVRSALDHLKVAFLMPEKEIARRIDVFSRFENFNVDRDEAILLVSFIPLF
jgi:hypothetical protein